MKQIMKNSILFLSVFLLLFSCTTQEEKVREYVEKNVVSQAEEYLICQAIINYMDSAAKKDFMNKFKYYANNIDYDYSYLQRNILRPYLELASTFGGTNKILEKRLGEFGYLYTMLSNEENIRYQMHQIDSTLTFKDLTTEKSIYSIDDVADIYFKPHHLKYTEITPQLYWNVYRSMLCLGAKTYKYDVVDEIRIKEKDDNKWTVDLVYHSGYCMPLEIGYNKEKGFFVSKAPWQHKVIENNLEQEATDEKEQEIIKEKEQELKKTYDAAEVKRLIENSKYVKYTNTRFGYSFYYPECFKMGEAPGNNDGREFYLGNNISFIISGIYNSDSENIKESYQNDEDRIKSSYHIQKDNWYVMSGNLENDLVYYKKRVLMKSDSVDGTYVTFYLKYPKKFNDALAGFINYVAKNFNPKYEGSDYN